MIKERNLLNFTKNVKRRIYSAYYSREYYCIYSFTNTNMEEEEMIDLHIHTTCSDGQLTVKEILEKSQKEE